MMIYGCTIYECCTDMVAHKQNTDTVAQTSLIVAQTSLLVAHSSLRVAQTSLLVAQVSLLVAQTRLTSCTKFIIQLNRIVYFITGAPITYC